MALKTRQREILQALKGLGGTATTRQIARKTGFNTNGVSQTLDALYEHVRWLGGVGGDALWELSRKEEWPSTR